MQPKTMSHGAAPDEIELAFTRSMPEDYAAAFDAPERAEHAAVVARRGPSTVHVEHLRDLPDGGALVCIVADDRPGLLSFVCNALLRHRLEVRVAQIYSRQRSDGSSEAVDFFWLRALPAGGKVRPISALDLENVAASLTEQLETPAEPVSGKSDPSLPGFDPTPNPRAFFNTKALRRGEYVLVIEVPDYPGLLFAITSALHAQGVEVASSDVRTEGDLARDCFMITDRNGGNLTPDRLASIRQAVVIAVRAGWQKARRGPRPSG